MLRNLFSPKRLQVRCYDFSNDHLKNNRAYLRRLLGAIVYQGMSDGMTKISIGVDCATGEPFMQYFGPLDYDVEKQIWWDMVPAPSEFYPKMLQVCLALAELEHRVPLEGIIPAIKYRKRVKLRLTVAKMESFEIGWDDEDATDRYGERGELELVTPGDDSANGGANNEPSNSS